MFLLLQKHAVILFTSPSSIIPTNYSHKPALWLSLELFNKDFSFA
jgi:hypothetical protein